MTWTWILVAWTALAALWWGISFLLTATASRRPSRTTEAPQDRRRITVFKPLAGPMDPEELSRTLPCIESFVAELDEDGELLIGCQESERDAVTSFLETMRERYPEADLRMVVTPGSADWPNPKVGTLQALARHATGELWLWSDADILAPPGTLSSLRADFAATEARLVTSPYVILDDDHRGEILDKLFVNVELYPGVELLGRLGRVHFGLGSGMLFEAEDFRRHVRWDDLASHLADDFVVGQRLGPATLGSVRLGTLAAARDGWNALLHYLRWQKTIRWCRPAGYAAQIAILPVLGWLTWCLLEPTNPTPWKGLGVVVALDSAAAWVICRSLGGHILLQRLVMLPLWSLLRGASWLLSWLPGPVVWRGRRWWAPVVEPGLQAVARGPEDIP